MIALKKERSEIRKKLKNVEKQIYAIEKVAKKKHIKIVSAERNKQNILGKKCQDGGQNGEHI
tara:strand:+ start:384 stop:569 length:186 start_codon:yes stop_codon:yes gene_type:complete